MSFPRASLLVMGGIGLLSSHLATVQAQESPVIVAPYDKGFIFFAGNQRSIFVVTREAGDTAKKPGVALDNLTVGFGAISSDLQELPEVKLECQGTTYVLPARKIIMVPPAPKTQGIFVQAASDPNGTGNYEVVLTINWSNWPDENKRIDFQRDYLPRDMEVLDNSASWSHPNGGLSWTGTLIFHNKTGRPFLLDPGYFDNLPTNEGWPVIEIPPSN